MRKTKILKRLIATTFALVLTLSGVVPGMEPLTAMAVYYCPGLYDVIPNGNEILFEEDNITLYVEGTSVGTFNAEESWANNSGNDYYVEELSDTEMHLDIPEVKGYKISVWHDASGLFGTHFNSAHPVELGTQTSISVDELLPKIQHDTFGCEVTIKDNKLYTDREMSNYYTGTLDIEELGELSYYDEDIQGFWKNLDVYTVLGVNHLLNANDKDTAEKEAKEDKKDDTPKEIEVPKTPETHYGTFQEDAINKVQSALANIKNSTANGTSGNSSMGVVIDTGIWVSFHKKVYEEIQKSNLPVTITFIYAHTRYTVTIPAGANVLSLVDENGYCGFLNLGAHYGYTEVEDL